METKIEKKDKDLEKIKKDNKRIEEELMKAERARIEFINEINEQEAIIQD
jgi:hypothetical protein